MSTTSSPAPIPSSTATINFGQTSTLGTTTTLTAAPTNSASCLPNAGLTNAPVVPAINIAPVNNATISWMKTCCLGAPVILWDGGCSAYCQAQGQNLTQLLDCYDAYFADPKNQNFTIGGGIFSQDKESRAVALRADWMKIWGLFLGVLVVASASQQSFV